MREPEQERQPRSTGRTLWGAYLAIVVTLIVVNDVYAYRLIRLDARVHRLMTSSPDITLERVKSELADVIRDGGEPGIQDTFHSRVVFNFGNPFMRELYLDCLADTHKVAYWSMVTGASDEVDTARAADGRATRALLFRSMILVAIVVAPLPLLRLQSRVKQRSMRFITSVACILLCTASAGVGLISAAQLVFTSLMSPAL